MRSYGGGIGHRRHREQGQALVVVAAAALALAAMLAIVVDLGHVYATQRQMQQAADAAAMAAAQNWLASGSQLDAAKAVADARTYASLNGHATSTAAGNGVWDPAPNNGVLVNVPPVTGPYSATAQYVEVIISKAVDTYFAGVFSVSSLQVTARAVARGLSGTLDASLIALSNSDSAITTSGTSSANVFGNMYSAGGVTCNNGNIRVYQGAAYAVTRFGDRCLGGQLQADGGLQANVPRLYDPGWESFESLAPAGPGGDWSTAGKTPSADGYIHIQPGTYNTITVSPSTNVKFEAGVYHLLGEGNNPALNIQGNVLSEGAVQFVLEGGATHFEAAATGTLSSGAQYNNILIYSKRSDGGNAIQIAGGASFVYDGTIYAPGADVAIAGHSSATVNGQVVANTITLSGSSGTAIQWDGGNAPVITAPTLVE